MLNLEIFNDASIDHVLGCHSLRTVTLDAFWLRLGVLVWWSVSGRRISWHCLSFLTIRVGSQVIVRELRLESLIGSRHWRNTLVLRSFSQATRLEVVRGLDFLNARLSVILILYFSNQTFLDNILPWKHKVGIDIFLDLILGYLKLFLSNVESEVNQL